MPYRYRCESCTITLYRSRAEDKVCPVCRSAMERTDWTARAGGDPGSGRLPFRRPGRDAARLDGPPARAG